MWIYFQAISENIIINMCMKNAYESLLYSSEILTQNSVLIYDTSGYGN